MRKCSRCHYVHNGTEEMCFPCLQQLLLEKQIKHTVATETPKCSICKAAPPVFAGICQSLECVHQAEETLKNFNLFQMSPANPLDLAKPENSNAADLLASKISFRTAPTGESAETMAIKYDDGKLPLDLLPFEALEGIAGVLAHGARKYSAHNWRAGFVWSRPFAACLRHLFSWIKGEDLDPDSGLHHLDHAGCELLFLISFVKTKTGLDDRYVKTNSQR